MVCVPPLDETLFVVDFFCDTTAEIAARYGMTENAVKVTLSRARKKLRKHLESEEYL